MRHPNAAVSAALSAVLLAAACASVDVFVDWDREASFASYRTFGFFERPEGRRRDERVSPLAFKHA